jgi:hypothetical protein
LGLLIGFVAFADAEKYLKSHQLTVDGSVLEISGTASRSTVKAALLEFFKQKKLTTQCFRRATRRNRQYVRNNSIQFLKLRLRFRDPIVDSSAASQGSVGPHLHFASGSPSATAGVLSDAVVSKRTLQRIPAGRANSGLGRDKRTPKVPLAASSTRSTTVTVAE